MPTALNPRACLHVDPSPLRINQCVGTTRQEAQCRLPVSWKINSDLADASRLLDNFPSVEWCQAHPQRVLRSLKEIAAKTLCRNWHRTPAQIDRVASDWLHIIQSIQIPPAPRRRRASRQQITPPTSDDDDEDSSDDSSSTSSSSDSSSSFDDGATRPRRRASRNIVNINVNMTINPRRGRNIPSPSPSTESYTSDRSDTPSTSTNNSPRASSSSSSTSTSSTSSHTLSARSSDSQSSADLRRRVRELEAQLEELQGRQSSRNSTPTTSESGPSSFHREAAPSVSSQSIRRNGGHDRDLFRALGAAYRTSGPRVPAHIPSSATSSSRTISPRSNTPIVRRAEIPFIPVRGDEVQRKPITRSTECYVCYQRIHIEDQATWCRAGCGQNICLGCFDSWEHSQVGIVKCGFCRANWVYDRVSL